MFRREFTHGATHGSDIPVASKERQCIEWLARPELPVEPLVHEDAAMFAGIVTEGGSHRYNQGAIGCRQLQRVTGREPQVPGQWLRDQHTAFIECLPCR